jgi:hypothetical protein
MEGCINRDKNAVNNFWTIADHWLKYRKRPEVFKKQKLPTEGSSGSKPLKKGAMKG